MQQKPPYRYGKEYEGSHKGEQTLILPCAEDHNLELVNGLLAKHGVSATHLWLEVQRFETFNWFEIGRLRAAGFNVTVQVRDDADMPPAGMLNDISIVWMVPELYRKIAQVSDWVKVVHGPGPFDGFEVSTWGRERFPSERYVAEDQVWER